MTTGQKGPTSGKGLKLYGALGALAGGLAGFAVSSILYLTVNPLLERSSGLLRETQGLLWNLVPLLTAAGLLLGWKMADKRRQRPKLGHGEGSASDCER